MKKLNYLYLVLMTFPTVILAATNTPDTPTLQNLKDVGANAGYNPDTDFKLALASLVRVVLGFVGWIFFIFIIWSGFQWMTSGGNEQKLEAAKKRIAAATIGLTLVLMSYAIAWSINQWLASAVSNGSGTP